MSSPVAMFLLQVTVVSLSGVMSPGPITAATLAAGMHHRHAGARIALGHGIVELALILLLFGGVQAAFRAPAFRLGVAIIGGAVLLLMGIGLLTSKPATGDTKPPTRASGHIWTGIALSGGNPYFLLWWATVGAALITGAADLGLAAVVLFIIVHWLCDLVWLETLSMAAFRGSNFLGARGQGVVARICAVAMIAFGVALAWRAMGEWRGG